MGGCADLVVHCEREFGISNRLPTGNFAPAVSWIPLGRGALRRDKRAAELRFVGRGVCARGGGGDFDWVVDVMCFVVGCVILNL